MDLLLDESFEGKPRILSISPHNHQSPLRRAGLFFPCASIPRIVPDIGKDGRDFEE